MEAQNPENVSQANASPAERAQKKATRRAAFIQEVAEAVAQRFGRAVPVEVVINRNTLHAAGSLAVALGRAAHGIPAPAVSQPSPFEAEYRQARHEQREQEEAQYVADAKQRRQADVLAWAIHHGLLPATATELPSEEVQHYLLGIYPAALASTAVESEAHETAAVPHSGS